MDINRRALLKAGAGLAGMASMPLCASPGASPRRARYWHTVENAVACELCPHACVLRDGVTGICRVRRNDGGELMTLGYGNPCAVHVDPIEKKPLYHVLPGARAFSIAVAGCNFRCKNCQNHTISQASPLQTRNTDLPPEQVVERAVKAGCTTIAYTYSEPIVWYEYMYDTAKLAHEAGLRNLMITCGYVNEKPLRDLARYVDAANIDLKGFDAETYRKLNAGSLEAVKASLVVARDAGIFVELTNLVVPQWTDDLDTIRRMCEWISSTLGDDTPLHFSRFYPQHQLAHLYPTPADSLMNARRAARGVGLRYVYVGNLAGVDSSTRCPGCHAVLIDRRGYRVLRNDVTRTGKCVHCGASIAGIWDV